MLKETLDNNECPSLPDNHALCLGYSSIDSKRVLCLGYVKGLIVSFKIREPPKKF